MVGKVVEKAKAMDARDWGNFTGQVGFEIGLNMATGGGAGIATGMKAADLTGDAMRAAQKLDKALEATRTVDKASDATRAVDKLEDVADADKAVDKAEHASDTAKAADKAEDVADAAGPEKLGDVVYGGDEVEDAAKGIDKFAESAFDEGGKLKPNVKFKTGEFSYIGETDELGRLSKARTPKLKISETDRLKHDSKTPGKLEGDHAGHLFGDRFGGSPKLDNLVSQAGSVNLSKFKKIENQWARDIAAGKKVEAEILVNYESGALRPSSFDVNWSVDGEEFFRRIKNK